ncbi:transcription factor bHLH129-like [Ananas comosus]|uniref:Transcription factor bHLH129-like n=1 Tax=Ananas comosus TaxID=4615 RepID=A0A6P5GUD5_ANACO|nr:transcription factor bHLH129-like [Ananas comosus]
MNRTSSSHRSAADPAAAPPPPMFPSPRRAGLHAGGARISALWASRRASSFSSAPDPARRRSSTLLLRRFPGIAFLVGEEGEEEGGGERGNPLDEHRSFPWGLLPPIFIADNGLSLTRDRESYSRLGSDSDHAVAGDNRRLNSQLSLSFSRQQSTLSQISEIGLSDVGESSQSDEGNAGHSLAPNGFSIGSWDETNSIVFSAPVSKRGKDNNGDVMASLSHIESQFGLPRSSLEMATMENFLQIQQDQVPFKVRAKRGCATHPRSIAERERRTRISEKLRKLQELVPNMDKQTNTADMLDLAIQHIKGLQSQVQILSQERDDCRCGSKREKN